MQERSLGLDKGVEVAHHYGIHLRRGDGLAVLADVQFSCIDDLRYLPDPHPALPLGEDIEYGVIFIGTMASGSLKARHRHCPRSFGRRILRRRSVSF